jgi:hypothetical protein
MSVIRIRSFELKTKDLIKILETKEDEEIEFIVLDKDGNIVCMDVATQAKPIIKMLKLFRTYGVTFINSQSEASK